MACLKLCGLEGTMRIITRIPSIPFRLRPQLALGKGRPNQCLLDSLTASMLLSIMGVPHRLVIGVASEPSFICHAWLEGDWGKHTWGVDVQTLTPIAIYTVKSEER